MDYVEIKDLLKSFGKLLENYRREKETFDSNQMNIFSSISDAYKRENYTSDILRFILTPNAMGTDIFLKEFLRFIELSELEIKAFFSNEKNIEVCREEHRIDVLIRNNIKKKAIIIESKLNDADDQPMQLLRYYKSVTKGDGFEVLRIIYLTINPKNPKFEFSEGFEISHNEYKELINAVNEKLFKVFISFGKTTKEFHSFRDYLGRNELQKSDIIQQFSRLLKKLGGEALMTETEILEKILSNVEDLNNIKSLADLWNTKGKILYEIFDKNFPNLLPDKENWERKDDGCYYSKDEIANNVKLYFCPQTDFKENFWTQIGFYATKRSAFKGIKPDLKKIFTDIGFNSSYDDSHWYGFDYVYDEKEKITLNDYYSSVKNVIEKLQQKSKELK